MKSLIIIEAYDSKKITLPEIVCLLAKVDFKALYLALFMTDLHLLFFKQSVL